jgi:hypothetical protein
MEVNFAVKKLKELSGLNSLDQYLEEIENLVEAHNNKKINLHNKFRIISKQIKLHVDNIYQRTIELLKYGKDSSSLEVYKLRYGDVEGPKIFEEKNKKSAQSLENYIKKYGEIEGPIKFKEYSKSRVMSLEMCIKRHGEIEGPKVFRKYWDNTSFSTSKRAFKRRFGDDWEKYYDEFRNSIAQNNTLEGKISKYGEELGLQKFKEANSKKSKSLSKDTFVEKLLKQGLSFEEIQLAINDRWDNTSLKSFITRYDEEEGTKRYNNYVNTHKENNPLCMEYYEKNNISEEVAFEIISKIQYERNRKVNRFSKESLIYFNKLNEILTSKGYECKYKEEELGILLTPEEYSVYKIPKMFFYDFYILDLNILIEYNGFRFHDDIDYNSTIGVKKKDLHNFEYNKDFYKKWLAESRGYTVLVLRSWKIDDDLHEMFNVLQLTEEEKCKFV